MYNSMVTGDDNIHRIGVASVDNLRLKPKEAKLTPPGISVLKAPDFDAPLDDMKEYME